MRKLDNTHGKDLEEVHVEMDELMQQLLRTLGYGEGVDIFDEREKWWA